MAVWRYQLDPELAACYDTSAGVGIPGRKKVEVNRVKGLAIYWVAVPIFGVAAALYYLPDLLSRGITHGLDRGQPKPGPITQPADIAPHGHQGNVSLPTPKGGDIVPAPQKQSPDIAPGPLPDPVYVRSFAVLGKEALVTLTNGETLSSGTGLAAITRDYVFTKDGKRYQIRRGGGQPAQPAAAP